MQAAPGSLPEIRGSLQEHLVHQLYKEDLFDTLTEEHGSVADERQECHDAVALLRAFLETLDSIPADLWEALEDGNGCGGAKSAPRRGLGRAARPRPPHNLPTFFFQRRISTSGLSTIKHTTTKACSHSACKKSMQHSATFQSEVRRGTQHVTNMHNSSHFRNQPISGHHGTTAHAQTAANSQPNPAASAPIPRPRHLGPPTLHCS